MAGWYRHDYPFFERSIPKEVKGGIKAQSKRGTFGESWWAKRWIGVLESFNIGARLGRGRSYARRGQVLSIEIDKGRVRAKVQGSRAKPYDIKIEIKVLSAPDWKKLAEALSRQILFTAKLLAGQMPPDIEIVFDRTKLSLFPRRLEDLKTDCSCPDWSNPCKHIAAVYYLLGEEFDRDPFLIFKLRGMNREELLGLLGGTGEEGASKKSGRKRAASRRADAPSMEIPSPEPPPKGTKKRPRAGSLPEDGLTRVEVELPPPGREFEELPSDASRFWNGAAVPDDFFGEVRIPPVSASLPKRLGSFPFWRGEERFLDAMEKIYFHASFAGLNLFLAQGKEDALLSGETS
jgi:uncharacterized Zn finger protein